MPLLHVYVCLYPENLACNRPHDPLCVIAQCTSVQPTARQLLLCHRHCVASGVVKSARGNNLTCGNHPEQIPITTRASLIEVRMKDKPVDVLLIPTRNSWSLTLHCKDFDQREISSLLNEKLQMEI